MADRKQKRVKRRRGLVEVVNALLTLLVVGILVAGGLAFYGAHSFYAVGPAKQDTTFVVQKGNNLSAVADRLEQQGLVDSRYVFEIGGWALNKRTALKTGEYKVTAGASMFDILKALTEGKPISLSVTVPEGFTIAQVIDRLTGNDKLTGDIANPPAEGSLLPDTYDFDPGATRQSVLDRMEAAMTAKVADIWQNRDQSIPLTSPDQLTTLASIVEKETPVPSERAQIAAVYYNRLVKHMRLQSDPTVVYGITKGAGPTGRAPTRTELDQPTAYNTYQINGLPPGPIANPGAEALQAAAHPEKNANVYFVAAGLNPKDGHLFAADYADHRKNVAKLRVLEKQQAKADAADSDAAKDALEQQQAAAAGDPTADSSGPAAPAAADQSAPASPQAPASPPADAAAATPSLDESGAVQDNSNGTTDQPSPTAAVPSIGDSNAPVPMPADQRPAASDSGDATPAPAAAPADKPAVAPAKPVVKPVRPRPVAPDAFGG
ncbi:MAG: endolytic transglycosylase MltG [Devosia sp.]